MSTTEKSEQIPATETSKKEEPKKTAKTEATLPDGTKFLQQEPTAENEIHVAAKGHIKNYLGYAFRILNKTNHQQLKIRATGNAIVKANILIELVKRRVGDLHQLNSIYSMVISSAEEKLGEKIETKRRVTAMDTLLSKTALDPNDPGYQEPAPKDEPYHSQNRPGGNRKKNNDYNKRRHGGGGGGKLYNTPKDDDKDGKDKDKRRGGMRDNRTRRDKITAPGAVKDDERRGDRMDRSRGGFGHGGGYGRPMGGDGRPPPYGMQGDRQGYRPRGGRPYDGNMTQGGYPPRSYDDSSVRPSYRGDRGQRGNYRGYGGRPDYNQPRGDMYSDAPPPHYNQPPYGGGYGGGYNRYNDGGGYGGPPPDRRYNRGGFDNDRGGPRYNEPRGPRPPYDSERDQGEHRVGRGGYDNRPARGGYHDRPTVERQERQERSERPGPPTDEPREGERRPTAQRSEDKQPESKEDEPRAIGTRDSVRGKPDDGRRGGYNDRSDTRAGPDRSEREPRDDNREPRDRPRYNEGRGGFNDRGGYNDRGGDRDGPTRGGPYRGGGGYEPRGGYNDGGYRGRGGPRGDYRGGYESRGGYNGGMRGGPREGGYENRDNRDDQDGGRSRFNGGGFEQRGEGGPRGGGFENRGIRGALRGGRGGRGGFDDGERNFGRGGYNDRGGSYMHRGGYNDRRDGMDDSRGRGGMPPGGGYGGRGGGRDGMDGGRRGFGSDDRGPARGGYDEGRPAQHVIKTKTRGGAGAGGGEGGDD